MDPRRASDHGTEPRAEPGTIATEAIPDPAPLRDLPEPAIPDDGPDGIDVGGGGEPVGNDNIRTGRVRGVLGTAHGQHGQGQGG